MTTETLEQAPRLRLSDVLVVDADVHAHESPAVLAPYCDMPWRRSLEQLSTARPVTWISGFAPALKARSRPSPRLQPAHRHQRRPDGQGAERESPSIIGILFPD